MEGLVERERAVFHWADYVIFAITILISAGVGIYFAVTGGRQKTTSEFLVGDRKLKVTPVALSLIVSLQSSVLMLGFPAEVYGHGTQFWMFHIGLAIAILFVAQVFVPLIHQLEVTSVFEYLEYRFKSRAVRLLGSVLGILDQTCYLGIVLYGPATALEAVTRFPVWYSVILIAVAAVFYTSLGGIKAVIWADAIQFVIMVGGVIGVLVMGSIYVGGFDKMWQLNVDGGRVKFLDFDPNPLVRHTFWSLVFGNAVRNVALAFNQSTVQRVASMETLTKARIIVLCTIPGFTLFGTLACMEGMVSYAYFSYTECDPYGAKILTNTNQVLPYVVMELFRKLPGLPGLFLASLFSASLSTLSSAMSGISAMVWKDFLQPHMTNASERKAAITVKIIVMVFGVISIGIAFLFMQMGGPLQQISYAVLGSIAGPLTGMFVAGSFFPFTNAVGTIIGAVVSFGLSMWLSLGSSFSPYTQKTPYLDPAPIHNCYVNGTFNATSFTTPAPVLNATTEELPAISAFYSISYQYFGPISMLTCILVAVIASIATGGCSTAEEVDPKYIVPLWDNICCCLPESCRQKFRYKGHKKEDYYEGVNQRKFHLEIPNREGQVTFDPLGALENRRQHTSWMTYWERPCYPQLRTRAIACGVMS